MTTPERLSPSGRLYVSAVVAAGVAAVLHSLYSLLAEPVPSRWLMLALLTLVSGSFTVRIPSIPARLSVSEIFVFTAVLMFGPAAATMIVVLDTLVISFWLGPQSSPPWSRVAFNVAASAVAIWVAATSFYYLTGMLPLSQAPGPLVPLLPWLLGLATLYFILNSWLVALIVGFHKRRSPLMVWRQSFLWLSLNYYSGASVAALLLPYLMQYDNDTFIPLIGVVIPVLLISYLTFKTALGRIEDANKHLSELNTLYLSTIETLAMAIDAKDQITHGHIRRVQQHAVRLAKHVGVADPALISAIEAASLLHDMGKLAVPEYILNKPGTLTLAEFERMKLHASVGADILSAIAFPYPVVPIVRHHHEHWDGTGYPLGLRGTDIPIGARILAVVDCFDALTSDRPYRPRLSDEDAIRILRERRGAMYDPLIVDAFLDVHAEPTDVRNTVAPYRNEPLLLDASRGSMTLGQRIVPTEGVEHSAGLDDIAASSEETLVLYDLATALTGLVQLAEAADVIVDHLRRVVPASIYVLFVYEVDTDALIAEHAVGDGSPNLIGLRIPRGERLSGWVGANKQTILNSDPLLDLGDAARSLKPRLRSCISTPFVSQGQLVGVLTLYSVQPHAYSDDHKRILEVVAQQVSQIVQQVVALDTGRRTLAGKPSPSQASLRHLEGLIPSLRRPLHGERFSLVFVTVRSLGQSGPASRLGALTSIDAALRKGLRVGDSIFNYGSNEFVVVLSQTDADLAQVVAERIRANISTALANDTPGTWSVNATLGVATAPADGLSVGALVAIARQREQPVSAHLPPTLIH